MTAPSPARITKKTRWLLPLLATSVLASFGVGGCQTTNPPAGVSSLRSSGQVSFICIGPDQKGAPLDRCPQGGRLDRGGLTVAREGYELHALLTQTVSAEVAVVRLTGADENGNSLGRVLDVDSSNPGVTPLRVGQKPIDVVTTPGGHASFVSVAEPGHSGIFALPTSCIFEPKKNETQRDLTTWPACSLPSPPGQMLVLVDAPDASGQVRSSCGSAYSEPETPASAERSECAVDLNEEKEKPGRRKLVVALPDEGRLVVLDAQALLDREPGSYGSCLDADVFEGELPLEVDLPARIVQPLPEDLVVPGCVEPVREYGPFVGPFWARPAGLAEQDGLLAVADQGAPVVHLVDAHSPCDLKEREPLVATSFLQPERVVTTSRVAISPLSPKGEQFLYALDEVGEKVASVMVFDLSSDSSSRTPLVRPGAPDMPLEPPDRVEFVSPAKDVAFALIDRPEVDPITGTSAIGIRCNPDPSIAVDAPEALYRPSSESSTGARPRLWRGLFGYVLLGNGQVAVIDIDDFDSDCRRPAELNASSIVDRRGCSLDPASPAFYTVDGQDGSTLTVTNEASCRVVEPHRARSANLMMTSESSGIYAPSLQAFPRLSRSGRGLAVTRSTPEGRKSPILLGVDFAGPSAETRVPAQVYVGNTLRVRGANADSLIVDPRVAEQSSVVLPWVEPRAYPTSEIVTVSYEGSLGNLLHTVQFDTQERSSTGSSNATLTGVLHDQQALFCDLGVQSEEVASEVGEAEFDLKGGALTRFARRHADYVQVVNSLLPEDDIYWQGAGKTCGESDVELGGFVTCDALFGDGEGEDLLPSRDLRIVRAYQDHLELVPRNFEGREAEELRELLSCCFPGVLTYRVRAGSQWIVKGEKSGFRHDISATPVTVNGETEYLCARDCSPLKAKQKGRAFELSNTSCQNPDPELAEPCGVGPRTSEDVVCSYDARRGPIELTGVGSECIFDGLTRRFAIYRGLEPSRRGMSFGFEVVGGFTSQTVSLTTTQSNVVLPVSLAPIPTFGQIGVVDSQSRGLMMLDLQSASIAVSYY